MYASSFKWGINELTLIRPQTIEQNICSFINNYLIAGSDLLRQTLKYPPTTVVRQQTAKFIITYITL